MTCTYSPPQRFPTKMVVYFYFMIARAAAYRPGPLKPEKEVHDHFRWEPLWRRVTCTFSPVSLNLNPPRPEMGYGSSFLEPVGHSLRFSADLNRRHKPVAEPFLLCLTLFPSFVKTKAFSEEQEARQLIKFKAKFFSHLLLTFLRSSGHRRLKFFPLNF